MSLTRDEVDEKIQFSIAAIDGYLAQDTRNDFLTLVKQFDESIAKLSSSEITPALASKIKRTQDKILSIYSETFTTIAQNEFKKVNLQTLTRTKDFASKISNVTELSGDLAESITLHILNEEDDAKRQLLIERYIFLANKLIKEGNFFSANAIYQGLSIRECAQLYKNDFGSFGLNKDARETLKTLTNLFGKEVEINTELENKINLFEGPKLPVLDKIKSDTEKKYAGSEDIWDGITTKLNKRLDSVVKGTPKELNDSDSEVIKKAYLDLIKARSELQAMKEMPQTNAEKIKAKNEIKKQRGALISLLSERKFRLKDFEIELKNSKNLDETINRILKEHPVNKTALTKKIQKFEKDTNQKITKGLTAVQNSFHTIYLANENAASSIDLSISPITIANSTPKSREYLTLTKNKSLKSKYNDMEQKLSHALKNGPADDVKKVITALLDDIKKIEEFFPKVPSEEEYGQEEVISFETKLMSILEDKSFNLEKYKDMSERISFQSSITEPAELMRKQLTRKMSDLSSANKSQKILEKLQNRAKEDLIKIVPSYENLLVFQDTLEKRHKETPSDLNKKARLEMIKKINNELCAMQMNNIKTEEKLDQLIQRIQEVEQLENNLKKESDTTGVYLLYDVYNDIMNAERRRDETADARMNTYQALQGLKNYHSELERRKRKTREEDPSKINVENIKSKMDVLGTIIKSVDTYPKASQKISYLEATIGDYQILLEKHHLDPKGVIKELQSKDTSALNFLSQYLAALKQEEKLASLATADPLAKEKSQVIKLIYQLKQYANQHSGDIDKQKLRYANKLISILEDNETRMSDKVEKIQQFLHKDALSMRHQSIIHHLQHTDQKLVNIIAPFMHDLKILALVESFETQDNVDLDNSFDSKKFNVDDRIEVQKLVGGQAVTYKVSISPQNGKEDAAIVIRRLEHNEEAIKARQALKRNLKEHHLTKELLSRPINEMEPGSGIPYQDIIITEFCPRGSLYHADDNDIKVRREHGIKYLKNLTDMILDFHDSNVFFMDIKPSNFLIHKDGHLLISDVKSLIITDPNSRTINSQGKTETIAYLPPEEFASQSTAIDKDAIERYQIGLTLYEYLTKHEVSKEKRKTNHEHPFNFDHEVFTKDENGKFLKTIIQGLTHPNKNKRLSLEQVKELSAQFENRIETGKSLDEILIDVKKLIAPKPLPKIPTNIKQEAEQTEQQQPMAGPSLEQRYRLLDYITHIMTKLDERIKVGTEEEKLLFTENKQRLENLAQLIDPRGGMDVFKDKDLWDNVKKRFAEIRNQLATSPVSTINADADGNEKPSPK